MKKDFLKKILKWLNPDILVGGLEISDNFLRYVLIGDNIVKKAALRLPPGIISGGRIKDRNNFLSALGALKKEIGEEKKTTNVVLTIGIPDVYTQIFSVPQMAGDKMEEATELNLKMISPIDVSGAYYDRESLLAGNSGEAEFLGAFVEKVPVDEFLSVLREAGFAVIVVEFFALSAVRAVKELGNLDLGRPYLALNVLDNGVDFMLLRGGRLYFHYFTSWGGILEAGQGRQIDNATFQSLMLREVARVLNFHSSKWGSSIKDALLLTPGLGDARNILEKFFALKVYDFTPIPDPFRDLNSTWAVSLGAALRGLLPRAADDLISLAPLGTELEYKRERLRHFTSFWRNVLITVFSAVFLVFLAADGFLANIEKALENEVGVKFPADQLAESETLRLEAEKFNAVAVLVLAAKNRSIAWEPVLRETALVSGTGVSLRRISINGDSGMAFISGKTTTELAAINFKNNLSQNALFEDVSLPFSNITPETDGQVSFQLTLKVKKG